MRHFFECEFCGNDYETAEGALKCERAHTVEICQMIECNIQQLNSICKRKPILHIFTGKDGHREVSAFSVESIEFNTLDDRSEMIPYVKIYCQPGTKNYEG